MLEFKLGCYSVPNRGPRQYSTHHYTKRDMLAYMSKHIVRTIAWWSGASNNIKIVVQMISTFILRAYKLLTLIEKIEITPLPL